jgi:hypothetical protein
VPEHVIQLLFLLGFAAGLAAGIVLALVVLLGWFMRTEATDEAPANAIEDAYLHGTGILSRAPDGTLTALSPSEWTIRRRRGMR